MIEYKKTICPLDCPDTCGIIATVEDGVITKLKGDPGHEFTRGFLCSKMRHYHHRIQSKSRILYPQLRTGTKGSGEFKQISWDNAWEILVEKLRTTKRKFGGESLLPYSYAGNMGHINRFAGYPFFHRYGASRLNQTICSAAASAGWNAHCPGWSGTDPKQAAKADLIIAWGINIKVTNIHFWPLIQESRRKGGKLVVIDPYRNITGKAADIYYPVKPGGDAALALGVIKHIINCHKECLEFIEQYTSGYNDIKLTVQNLSWQELETASGLPKEEICSLATLLTNTPKSFIRIGMGLTRNTRGAMSVRAITCLALILGLFDQEEGRGTLLSSSAFTGNSEKLLWSKLAEKETRLVNMIQLGQALTQLNPPIKSLFVYNSNPASVAPDSSRVRRGLLRDNLFTIVHEQVMTPTARYADLLLPATTSFENSDIYTAYGHFYLGLTRPVIEPQGEAISNFTLFQTLAQKMGYVDAPFYQTVEDRLQDFLSDLEGIPVDTDRSSIPAGKYIKSAFAENRESDGSGKEKPFVFKSKNIPPTVPDIPCLIAAREFDNPDFIDRYPLKLITPPNGKMLNSTFGELYSKQIGHLLIHPDDALSRQIKMEDRVIIQNSRGSSIRQAEISLNTQKGVVVAEGIYWDIAENSSWGINSLTSQETTDLGDGSTFHESMVEIKYLE